MLGDSLSKKNPYLLKVSVTNLSGEEIESKKIFDISFNTGGALEVRNLHFEDISKPP